QSQLDNKKTKDAVKILQSQMSELTSSISKLESQGRLPSQPEINPRQNVNAITLRSGKEIEIIPKGPKNADKSKLPELHGHAEADETEPQ
uniref:hypothetical protein n=1 Tax=Vibrio vulnificus TaxID=672 RepID=UPI0019D42453